MTHGYQIASKKQLHSQVLHRNKKVPGIAKFVPRFKERDWFKVCATSLFVDII